MSRTRFREMPGNPASVFGAAWLPDGEVGVDIASAGYVEQEIAANGEAGIWGYDDAGSAALHGGRSYSTRLVIRRPADPHRFSGTVLLEPLHPDLDKAPTWRMTHRWVLAEGHAWVGVTHSAAIAADLAERFERYRGLDIPRVGAGFSADIVGQIAVSLKAGELPVAGVARILLSGWSITGSLCRVYLQDGFLGRHAGPDGAPAVDGILIGKSSGAFGRPGFPPLSEQSPPLPDDDPRRTVRGLVPTFEVLSETEGETHLPVLRDDSDAPGDRYRLYQVAGTSHRQLQPETILTNDVQYAATGGELGDTRINEEPSDERFELFGSALFAALLRWVADDVAPPRAPRFAYAETGALARDADGVVVGGIRPPWISVPTAVHRPSSTPAPGACLPLARFPATGGPEQAASMIGHRIPFSPEEFALRYGGEADYRARLAAACDELVAAGLATRLDADSYLAEVLERRSR